MKQIKIPFSLEEYQKGYYEVETKGSKLTNPHKVRIVCIDRKYEDYPILALILYETVEKAACYRLDGRYIDLHNFSKNNGYRKSDTVKLVKKVVVFKVKRDTI